jgi:hypothetical protein
MRNYASLQKIRTDSSTGRRIETFQLLRITEVIMECINCGNAITPGTEIVVDEILREMAHCPYCLQILAPEPALTGQKKDNEAAKRDEMRAKVRKQFVDRLLKASPDGQLHCPVCEHTLNQTDEQLLRDSEYFRCHLCGHDLATVAYRQEVYHEQRWLPVVFTLQDLLKEESCTDCCYVGAIAKACQKAYSWMPKTQSKHREQLARIARQPHRNVPDCDLESCVAVAQYRKLAGEGLLLL